MDNLIIIPLRNATYAGKLKANVMLTFEYFFVQISIQVWLKVELNIRCYSDFRCEVTVVYARNLFVFQYDHFRCLDLDLDLDYSNKTDTRIALEWPLKPSIGYMQKISQNKNTLSDFILPLQMHVQNHERVQNFWFYPFRKKLKENPVVNPFCSNIYSSWGRN